MVQTLRYTIQPRASRSLKTVLEITDESDSPIMYASSKLTSLSGNAEVFADESLQIPLLQIRTASILSGKYAVTDVAEGKTIGTLEHMGIGFSWRIFDQDGKKIGAFRTTSKLLFLTGMVLQTAVHTQPFARRYTALLNDAVCRIRHTSWPRNSETTVEFMDAVGTFDRRIGLALGILLHTVPG